MLNEIRGQGGVFFLRDRDWGAAEKFYFVFFCPNKGAAALHFRLKFGGWEPSKRYYRAVLGKYATLRRGNKFETMINNLFCPPKTGGLFVKDEFQDLSFKVIHVIV